MSVRYEALTIDQLVSAAKAGDPRAGCRAARQLYDCAVLNENPAEAMLEGMDGQEAELAEEGFTAAAEQWGHVQLALIEATNRCKTVGPDTIAAAHTLLRQSALSGNRAAMLKYASGEFLGLSPGLEATRHPGYRAWRRDAHSLLLRAVRAGSLEAIHALSIAHAMEDGAIGGVIPDDPVESHMYKFLFHLASGEHPGDGLRLAPAQREAALRRARRLHVEIFAGGFAEDEAAVLGPSWFNAGNQGDADPCR